MALHRFSGCHSRIIVPQADVLSFNAQWPCSTLRSTRHYWFEFDSDGDLIDCDAPEHDDGPAASAMADDARTFHLDDVQPDWALS